MANGWRAIILGKILFTLPNEIHFSTNHIVNAPIVKGFRSEKVVILIIILRSFDFYHFFYPNT